MLKKDVGRFISLVMTNKKGTKYSLYFVPLEELPIPLEQYIRLPHFVEEFTFTPQQLKEKDMTDRFIKFCESP